MPRPKTPENAAGAAATARWRKAVREARRPEVDAVDSALAAALAVYLHAATVRGRDRDIERIVALERLAIEHLVSKRYDAKQARRAVLRRLRRDDAGSLATLADDASGSRIPPITPVK